MNTKLNKIFKSFDDVKLESQKVELNIVADLKKITDSAEKSLSDFDKLSEQMSSYAKLVVAEGKSYKVYLDGIKKMISELQKKFSELGMNYLENPEVKRAVELLRKDFDINQIVGYAQQVIK